MGWLALIVAAVIILLVLASMGFVFGERLLRRVVRNSVIVSSLLI